MQVLGGYGYLHEYRLEQAYRDARICAIYEGANGIQALTLAMRGLSYAGGAQARAFADYIGQIAQAHPHSPLAAALEDWHALCDRVRTSPAEMADLLMQASIALAELAFWQRVSIECRGSARLQALVTDACNMAVHTIRSGLHFAALREKPVLQSA